MGIRLSTSQILAMKSLFNSNCMISIVCMACLLCTMSNWRGKINATMSQQIYAHQIWKADNSTCSLYPVNYNEFFSLLQASATTFFVLDFPPTVSYKVIEVKSREELHVTCHVPYLEIIAELLISGPWIVVACFCTLLARTLPDNNYEARTANFAACAAAITGISFCLIYLALFEPYQKQFYRFLGICVNAIMFIFCMFIVKFHSVYFVTTESIEEEQRMSGVWRHRAGTGGSQKANNRNSVCGNPRMKRSSLHSLHGNDTLTSVMMYEPTPPNNRKNTCNGNATAIEEVEYEDTYL